MNRHQISGRLRISESAVRLNLRTACRKPDLSTLDQATVKAMLLDLIEHRDIK
jgi:hypothetical protein